LKKKNQRGRNDMDKEMLIENNDLLKLIRKLKINYSKELEEELYKKIQKKQLLLPAILKGNNKVSIIKIVDNIGNEYLPIFTDLENYKLNSDNQKNNQTVIFSFFECKNIIDSDFELSGIVINPYSENLVLSNENLNFLEKKLGDINKGDSVSIGLPKDFPYFFVEKCKFFFEKEPSINYAFLLQMVKNNQRSLLLVIDTVYNEKMFSKIGKLSEEFLGSNKILDIVIMNTDFGRKVTEGYVPFYKKNREI